MTPERPEPELTPEEDAEVTRLLAEASGPLTTPDDVVARLDATLADLVREREATPAAPVVPLATRRRWPKLLVAAAAVVVGGYAVGTAVTGGSFSGEDALSGAAERASDSAGDSAGGGSAEEPAPEAAAPSTAQEDAELGAVRTKASVVSLSSDTLEADVQRVVEATERRELAGDRVFSTRTARCGPDRLERGQRRTDVRYDGRRAVLVTGPAADGELPAWVYRCDGTLLDETVVDDPS